MTDGDLFDRCDDGLVTRLVLAGSRVLIVLILLLRAHESALHGFAESVGLVGVVAGAW